jgi:hypothetical protein
MKVLIFNQDGSLKASHNAKDVEAGIRWALKKGATKMRFEYGEADSGKDLAKHARTGPPQTMLRK